MGSQSEGITKIFAEIFGAWNWFFGFFILIVLGIFFAFAASSKIIAVYLLFMLLGVATRYPAARSPYDLSLMKPLTILLSVFDFRIAAFFAFTTWWLAKRWNPMEEYTYTIVETISISATALISYFFSGFAGSNLVTFALYFLLFHFIIGALILTPIQRPGTIAYDLVFNATEFLFTIFYNSLIIIAVAPQFLNYLGVHGWQIGTFSQLIKIFWRS